MSRPVVPVCATRLCLSTVFVFLLLLSLSASLHAQDAEHPMEAKGIQPSRGSFSLLPWESIDTYSGSVVLTTADLVLPGHSGLDLRVTRSFNSKGESWHIAVGPSMIIYPVVPPPYGPESPPKVRTADGGLQPTFETVAGSGVYMTTSLWRFTKALLLLEAPDGVVYHFLADGRLSQIADLFGNTIDVAYEPGLTRVTQHLGNGQDREVVLAEDAQGRVQSVTYNGRTWTYEYGTGPNLTVHPPVGPAWQFVKETTGSERWTLTVTTPNGGWVAYDFDSYPRFARKHEGLAHTWKAHFRRSNDAGPTDASWEILYNGMDSVDAVVQGPGRRLHYWHNQIGDTSVYLERVRVFAEGDTGETTPLEETTYTYRSWDNPNPTNLAPVGIAWPPYDPELDVVRSDPYPLLVKQVNTTRGASTWMRIFTYCGEPGQPGCPTETVNDAGLPRTITESGPDAPTRTLAFAYRHLFSAGYVRGRATSLSVTHGGDPYTSTYAYDDRGFLTSRSAWGVVTTFVPDGAGNVASVTDASGHTTSTSYTWGVPQHTTTPEYVITRTIYPDGTVASETRQGQIESFLYDDLGRVTQAQPRTGAATITTYDNVNGRFVTVSRGASSTTQTLDGYGRVTHTATAMGVMTDVVFDAAGRTVTTSAPYGSGTPRYDTTTQYDALDRLTSAAGVSGTQTFDYDALGNRWYPNNPSAYVYNPVTRRLDSVTAGGATTFFNYDATGNLWQMSGARAASFTYTPTGMLSSATVANTTTNYTYDSDGLRVTKVDGTTTHEYVYGLGQQLLADFVVRNGAPAWDVAYLHLGSRLFGAIRPSSSPSVTFTKQSPGNGAMGLPSAVTLQWSSTLTSPNYAVCWDTTNNDTCDASWVTMGTATINALTGLATGTYYWQAKDLTTGAVADNGLWWHFTVGTVTSAVSKIAPANGPATLGRSVTLQWGSTLTNPTYWVCWDTSNNNTCNYTWLWHGSSPTWTLNGLASGTYAWPFDVSMHDAQGHPERT